MNRADAMLEVLRWAPGEDWVSRRLILSQADRFFLTNNAASELRARGYDVEHRVIKGQHHYRLLSEGPQNIPSSAPFAEQALPGGPTRSSPPLRRGSDTEPDAVDAHPLASSGQLSLSVAA